jgi:hypothetical protein
MKLRTVLWLLVLIALLGGPDASLGATRWVSVTDLAGAPEVCLESDGRRFTYVELDAGSEVRCRIAGPRRLKVISRYLFADDDPDRVPYTLTVHVDGREVLRKGSTGRPLSRYGRCRSEGRVASLRRGYVDLPAGQHDITVRASSEGGGTVAIRLYRQVKFRRDSWMSITPEHYDSVRHLEFESGNRSTYYHFDATTPLGLNVTGPTTLRLRTRLDFDHLMNGSQTYALDVLIDDESWRTFHFDTQKLSSAVWLEHPDILPGSRRELKVEIPRGRHTIEIRCVRPESCGVAAMLHIPKRDLDP